MTPRERLFTALARGTPDRVPIMEMAIDWKVIRGLGCRGYFDLIERLDLDGVAVNQVLYLMGLRRLSLSVTRRYTDVWGVRKRLLHELMPQAMLFMRGGNAGISHNPLETITDDDTELCVAAFARLLEDLAHA